MGRERTTHFLDEVSATEGALSLYFQPGLSVSEIEELTSARSVPEEILQEIVGSVASSKNGAALFVGQHSLSMVLPPFPVPGTVVIDGCDVDSLQALLRMELKIALVIVRLGDYAIGVFQGEKRISSKTGTGLVHSRHKKGGSSQRRFERHREKQMEMFFTRVCGHVREQLEPCARELDYVIYGGEWNTLRIFRKQCRFLASFEDRTLERILNVRKPRQPALEAAITEVWTSEIAEWNLR